MDAEKEELEKQNEKESRGTIKSNNASKKRWEKDGALNNDC
jgi:hypothetical protein